MKTLDAETARALALPAVVDVIARQGAEPAYKGPKDFADHIQRNFAGRVPVVKAENSDWWIHGVASMARETALAREAREVLTEAEKACSIALLLDPRFAYPAADFGKAVGQAG